MRLEPRLRAGLEFCGGRRLRKKKAKSKRTKAAKKAGKKSSPRTKKPVDFVRVRQSIANLVGNSAKAIATEVIKVAKTGQLAPARYLFEVVGIYPKTEETEAKPQEDSLAHTLLKRMGLPIEPVICEEDAAPSEPRNGVERSNDEAGMEDEDKTD